MENYYNIDDLGADIILLSKKLGSCDYGSPEMLPWSVNIFILLFHFIEAHIPRCCAFHRESLF